MAADAVLGGIVGKIVEKIWDYTVDPIVQQFSYFCCFNRNIEKLETQLGELQPITQGVQQWVDVDHLKGRVIAPRIETWLKSANDVESEAGEIIKEKPEVKKGCLNGCIRWCSNFKRYSLSKEAVKKTKVIVNLQKEGGEYTRPSYSPPPTCTKTLPSKDNMAFESRSLNMEEIIKALKDNKVNLIGICGLPGVGKTTMAKEIRKQAKEGGLFVEVTWAAVGQTQKLADVQACIADMLGLKQLGDRPNPVVRADLLRERLLQDNKKILVILDDIWAEFDLEEIGIPLGGANKNFKMLYTSRNRGLWHDQEITKIEIPLELLSKDEAWELFKKQVGNCADAPVLQPIAKEIVNACGSLPLALVLIGKALSEESSGNITVNIWEDVRDRLTCSSSTPEDRDWSPTLELSYRAVKDEEAKRLFLLCCLFEEDKAIPVEVLARYALGFSIFHDRINGMRSTRNRVLKLVADLERRYLLLDDPYKRYDKHVKVHDLVRDMGISIASKCKGALGSHGTVSEYPKKDVCEYALVSHGAVSEWPNKDKFQHYTCISVISEEIIEFPEELTCPNLEFLLLRCRIPEKLSCHFFKGTEKLKVLELYEYAGIIPVLQPWTNLTMLSLENMDPPYLRVKAVIDPVIGSLLNLEILSFRYLGIEKLPEEIGKLIKLRLLNLIGTSRLETIPPRVISRLVRLEELYMMGSKFSYWEGEGEEKGINANLREFELLSNLNTLEIRIRSCVLIPKVPIFSKLKKYTVIIESKVKIESYDNNTWYFGDIQYGRELCVCTWPGRRDIPQDHEVLDSLLSSSDHILLQNNDLVRLQDNDLLRLQDGVDRLQQLKYLEIGMCKTPEFLVNIMNRVQQQPNVASTAVFPTLEKLYLHRNDGLRGICRGPILAGSFGQLTEIMIYACNSLKYLFPLPIVEFLTQLKILGIRRCATMEEVIWKEQREDVQIATSNRIEFSKLESLCLENLSSLVGFCRGIDRIDFPQLKELRLVTLGKLKRIVHDNNNQSSNSEPNNNVGSLSLFPQMVTFPSLEDLVLYELKNVSNELPAFSLSKLKELTVIGCDSWRNVFYPSMAAVLVNLQTLTIKNCSKMETIVDWEEGQEREIPKTLLPQLINLELKRLPRLTRFCHFTHSIELPLLSKIDISGCRSMNAFFFGPVSAPNFYFQGVSGNINQAIEFMQEEERRKEEEWRKGEEEWRKGEEERRKVVEEWIKEEERRKEEEERRKEEAEEMAKRKGWPMKVKHELHEHDLELVQGQNYLCNGCEEVEEVWSFYCKDCDFDLHPECALEENKATKGDNEDGLEEGATTKGWPKKVKHELHEHELELIKCRNYICDGCNKHGRVWFFYCKDCDFYLHRKCALEENKATKGDNEDGLEEGATTKGWPKKVKHELHEHELELIKRENYICDGCKERGKLWFFYCKDCDFYLHRKCALE